LTQQKQRVTFSKRKMISVSRHSLREVELTKLDQKVSDQVKKDLGLQKTVSRVPTGGTPPLFSLERYSGCVSVRCSSGFGPVGATFGRGERKKLDVYTFFVFQK
jgi:hypothetical protein